MRFWQFRWIQAIVLGDGSMDTERYRLRLSGQQR
jgi:hypothetical protein